MGQGGLGARVEGDCSPCCTTQLQARLARFAGEHTPPTTDLRRPRPSCPPLPGAPGRPSLLRPAGTQRSRRAARGGRQARRRPARRRGKRARRGRASAGRSRGSGGGRGRRRRQTAGPGAPPAPPTAWRPWPGQRPGAGWRRGGQDGKSVSAVRAQRCCRWPICAPSSPRSTHLRRHGDGGRRQIEARRSQPGQRVARCFCTPGRRGGAAVAGGSGVGGTSHRVGQRRARQSAQAVQEGDAQAQRC